MVEIAGNFTVGGVYQTWAWCSRCGTYTTMPHTCAQEWPERLEGKLDRILQILEQMRPWPQPTREIPLTLGSCPPASQDATTTAGPEPSGPTPTQDGKT